MARLKDFISYLKGRLKALGAAERQLLKLQEKYESFFQEVARVREEELGQLTAHILADRSKLPGELNMALDQAEQEQERKLELKLKRLRAKRHELLRKAEQERSRSNKAEKRVRAKNTTLDNQEEKLKERNAELLRQIDTHNQRIRQLGKGWGFFANLFRMRDITRERTKLDEEQTDVTARVEALRVRWAEAEKDHVDKEERLAGKWVELTTEAAAVQAKVEHLEQSRSRVILRSTVEQVLFDRAPDLPEPAEKDPPCPRCKTPNPEASHFCRICANRLKEDRPDLDGSILEIAELNMHHDRFSDGMRSCQQLIGLVRGLRSGVTAFQNSVEDVKASEDKHPLPKLDIDVPKESVAYGEEFDKLAKVVGELKGLKPTEFGARVDEYVGSVFTEENIKVYFERMGKELSRQAKSQW